MSENWYQLGQCLVTCLRESLDYTDPLLKMVVVMKTSLVSGNQAQ